MEREEKSVGDRREKGGEGLSTSTVEGRAWGHGLGEAREGAGARVSPWGWQAVLGLHDSSWRRMLPLMQRSDVIGGMSNSNLYKYVRVVSVRKMKRAEHDGCEALGVGFASDWDETEVDSGASSSLRGRWSGPACGQGCMPGE